AGTGSIGLFGAVFPHLWLGLFSTHPEVLTVGTTYLQLVGPTYGCFGLGLALSFPTRGAGRLVWPLVAGVVRLVVAAGGGWVASHWLGGGLVSVFTAMAVAFVIYAAIVAGAIRAGAWHEAAHRPVTRHERDTESK